MGDLRDVRFGLNQRSIKMFDLTGGNKIFIRTSFIELPHRSPRGEVPRGYIEGR